MVLLGQQAPAARRGTALRADRPSPRRAGAAAAPLEGPHPDGSSSLSVRMRCSHRPRDPHLPARASDRLRAPRRCVRPTAPAATGGDSSRSPELCPVPSQPLQPAASDRSMPHTNPSGAIARGRHRKRLSFQFDGEPGFAGFGRFRGLWRYAARRLRGRSSDQPRQAHWRETAPPASAYHAFVSFYHKYVRMLFATPVRRSSPCPGRRPRTSSRCRPGGRRSPSR